MEQTKPGKKPATVVSVPEPQTQSVWQRETLLLYRDNLAAMRAWYQKRDDAGQVQPLNVQCEITLGDMISALDLAIVGQRWTRRS